MLSLQQKAASKKQNCPQIESDQLKRRQSLPITPQKICANVPDSIKEEETGKKPGVEVQNPDANIKTENQRRSSFPASFRRNSCKVS